MSVLGGGASGAAAGQQIADAADEACAEQEHAIELGCRAWTWVRVRVAGRISERITPATRGEGSTVKEVKLNSMSRKAIEPEDEP